MPSRKITDVLERESALDPRRSCIVQAPAGSGKTTLLTQRYLRLLSVVEQPESIVALTFTRKAAEEMRTRILSALETVSVAPAELDATTRQWAQAALLASEKGGWQLLDNPRRLRVQTIDSLAATIARRGPLISGIAGNASVLEDAGHLYRRAAHAAINQLADTTPWSDAVKILLRHLDNNWERLEVHLAEMLSRRDQWLRLIMRQPDRKNFEAALDTAVADELRSIANTLPPALHAQLVDLCRYAGGNIARAYPDNPLSSLARVTAVPQAHPRDLPSWQALADLFLKRDGKLRQRLSKKEGFPANDQLVEQYKASFVELADALLATPGLLQALHAVRNTPTPRYSESQWSSIRSLFSTLQLAAAELKVEFSRAGVVDFVEVAHAALAALGEAQAPSDLGLILDYQIQHLLIDEFQDTSITQFEMIERLIDGWVDGDGRSLFLVGDPMQSIYRFRQAEVSLFVNTFASAQIAAVRLSPLQLSTNFRTQAGVLDWVNDAIESMREEQVDALANAPKLIAARPATIPAAVQIHAARGEDERVESAIVLEIVQRSLAEHPEFSIGILVRGRRHLGMISHALIAAGVAVSANEIERLNEQSIVQDLVALTRALLHPADRVAWLAILRAPWCGLPLPALVTLFENEAHLTVWQRLQSGFDIGELTPHEKELLAGVCRALDSAMREVGREPIANAVERAWLALGGPDCYAATHLIHAERYFELLSACERKEPLVTAERLAEYLEQQYVSPVSQAAAKVEMMTIHRAKGLEFDVVIVPGLNRPPRSERHRLLAWKQHLSRTGTSLLFAPIPPTGSSGDAIHRYLHHSENVALEHESYRLLYVALTRARERLHLVARMPSLPDGSSRAPAPRSFWKMLWPAVNEELAFCTDREGVLPECEAEDRKRQSLRRFHPFYVSRARPLHSFPVSTQAHSSESIEFDWAGSIAKHVGTVTHEILRRISADGLSQWDLQRVDQLYAYVDDRMRGIGVTTSERDDACRRVLAALSGVLKSKRGRWILDDTHSNPADEYALTSVLNGKAINSIVDRTFIDTTGTRWIIDYKTGMHTGGNIDAFVASEAARYRAQLERYADLFAQREGHRIALGLFFPLLDAWHEWRYEGDSTQLA